MDNDSQVILGWAGRVAEIYRRLMQIEEEQASLIKELEAIRGGAPVPLAIFGSGPSEGGPQAPSISITGSATGIVRLPTGGTAKRVHEFMVSRPGEPFTPEAVTQALGLGLEAKPMVNTALSRLRRAGVIRRPEAGIYLYQPGNSDPPEGFDQEGESTTETY